ncbi:hypothetical protein [Nocardia macrotermitis]|uniref:Uncharacterized protein n=1 Tax=Nocardia macrotermitis TaxID=2585198 RepID=A0A7K0D8K6_9NOCA|nr:hypothetical protein [Nocardia macrotermitis]MQY21204.1 hypothetical protein [Nocardia macrotermitis]
MNVLGTAFDLPMWLGYINTGSAGIPLLSGSAAGSAAAGSS